MGRLSLRSVYSETVESHYSPPVVPRLFLPPEIRIFLRFGVGGRHEFPDRIEDDLKLSVVSFFKRFQLAGQVLVS